MAIIKMTIDNKRWQVCEEKWTLVSHIGTATMENIMAFLRKLKNKMTIWVSNSISEHISEENSVTILKRYLNPHVHCNIIEKNQDTETTQVSIRMDKENVIDRQMIDRYHINFIIYIYLFIYNTYTTFVLYIYIFI